MYLTPAEYVKYKLEKDVQLQNVSAIVESFIDATTQLAELRAETVKAHRKEEILSEQIYFRDEFITAVIAACNSSSENKKSLVKFIKTLLENSYIEL